MRGKALVACRRQVHVGGDLTREYLFQRAAEFAELENRIVKLIDDDGGSSRIFARDGDLVDAAAVDIAPGIDGAVMIGELYHSFADVRPGQKGIDHSDRQ